MILADIIMDPCVVSLEKKLFTLNKGKIYFYLLYGTKEAQNFISSEFYFIFFLFLFFSHTCWIQTRLIFYLGNVVKSLLFVQLRIVLFSSRSGTWFVYTISFVPIAINERENKLSYQLMLFISCFKIVNYETFLI